MQERKNSRINRVYNEREGSEHGGLKKKRHIGIAPAVASETWTWNKIQSSRIQVVEMRYVKGNYGMSRLGGESSESVYEGFSMFSK